MTRTKNLFLFLTLATILFAGTLASGTVFADDKDKKEKNNDNKNKPITLTAFCAKLDDKNGFPALVCTAISDLYSKIQNISLTPGPQGTKGDTGAAGPEGPAGKDGATGPTKTILRFEGDDSISPNGLYFNNGRSFTANSISDALLASSLSGVDGNLTHFRFHTGIARLDGNAITATVFKNGIQTSASCTLTSSVSSSTDCIWDGSITVLEGDLIAIKGITPTEPFGVNGEQAFVSITTGKQ